LSDVVIATGMDMVDAGRYMDSLVDHSHVTIEVEGNGKLLYAFPELLDSRGRDRGRDDG
jgi:hypothetical protein